MKNENVVIEKNTSYPLSLRERMGGAQVRGKNKKQTLVNTPSSVLRTSSPSRGKQTHHGFTLIELLVVVLIIGILAAVAVPQYNMAVAKSRLTQVKVLADSVAKAEEVFYLANNEYTLSFSELDLQMPAPLSDEVTQIDEETQKPVYTILEYDWGSLALHPGWIQARIYISNTSISYDIYFTNHATPGKKCVGESSDLTDLANRVCKSDTGTSTPWTGPGYNVWNY